MAGPSVHGQVIGDVAVGHPEVALQPPGARPAVPAKERPDVARLVHVRVVMANNADCMAADKLLVVSRVEELPGLPSLVDETLRHLEANDSDKTDTQTSAEPVKGVEGIAPHAEMLRSLVPAFRWRLSGELLGAIGEESLRTAAELEQEACAVRDRGS